MSSVTLTGGEKANIAVRQKTCRNTSKLRAVDGILKRARDLWSSKIALELAARTGVSVRTAENWLAGDRSIGGGALVALLSGDDGFEFLEAMVETMPAAAQRRWRTEFENAARRADLRRRQDALRRELDEAGL